jgi:integrase
MPEQLTETRIARAVREVAAGDNRQELQDAGRRGLWLRVNKTGKPTWVLRVRHAGGQQRRIALGYYPQLGLADARRAADSMSVAVRQGGADPIAEHRERRKASVAKAPSPEDGEAGSLRWLIALYGEQRAAGFRSWRAVRRKFFNVFAPLIERPLTSLTQQEIQRVADDYAVAHSASTANDAIRQLRPLLKWSARRGYCDRLLADLEPPPAPRVRTRVLSHDELRAVLRALTAAVSYPHYVDCMKFLALTCCRLREGSEAVWGEFDLKRALWIIPPARTKSQREHQVPLSRQTLELLHRQPTKGAGPAAIVFATVTGTAVTNWTTFRDWIRVQSGTRGWHCHDLRRTGATTMGELGIDPHVIESALGHVVLHTPLAAVYNRAKYLPQVAEALQMLADRYDELERGEADRILPFRMPA